MNYRYFIGIDVSEATLDITLLKEGSFMMHRKVENTEKEIKSCFQQLKSVYKVGGKGTLICLEHIGPYKEHLLQVVQKTTAGLWLESPLAIKRSLGLLRGKSDKIDSLRIARFAYLNRDNVRLYTAPRDVILELKSLSGLRQRLQTALFALQTPLKNSRNFVKKAFDKRLPRYCQASEAALKADIKRVEETMRELVLGDACLAHLYRLITSVKGIGERLAIELLIVTNEFKKFPSAKALACYCGIAPFGYTSGTSLQGKPHVSHLANRRLKTQLHMPALSAIQHPGELREYYLRKVAEGHSKMSVLNAVKNKLLQRVFACVRDDRLYRPDMASRVTIVR